MNRKPDPSGNSRSIAGGRYQEYVELVDREVRVQRDRCRRLAGRHRIWFRTSGMAVILFSVALPPLTAVNFPGRGAVVSVLASLIAGLSTLRAFYLWDRRWRLHRTQEMTLTALLTQWELGVIRLAGATQADADDRVHELTEKLLEDAREFGTAQHDEFFDAVVWPQRSG